MGDVRHNADESRYELTLEGGTAFATYEKAAGDVLVITHTVTPPELRGRGVASRLVRDMLADMRREGKKLVPLCSFVADYIDRHPEEQDLLADSAA